MRNVSTAGRMVAAFSVGAVVSVLVQYAVGGTVTGVTLTAAIATGLVAILVVDVANRRRSKSDR